MLETIKNIRALVGKRHPAGHLPYGIEDIRQAALEITDVDKITFFGFPGAPMNPMKGRFRRYKGAVSPYSGTGTIVEIDYDITLNYCWTQFVLCKEICHSLENDPSVQVNDWKIVTQLIDAIRVTTSTTAAFAFPPFGSEKMAEFAALELLCPVRDRIKMLQQQTTPPLSDMQIATAFRIPVRFVKSLFDPNYISLIEKLLK